MAMQNILIVDDFELLLEGIENLVLSRNTGYRIDKTCDPIKALAMLESKNYDLLISDYEMPQINGAQLAQAARKISPNIKVLILSMHDEKFIINQLIQLAVNGYVLKKEMYKELNYALAELENDNNYFCRAVQSFVNEKLENPEKPPLSIRELEILKLMASQKSNEQIANRLHLNLKTISVHEKNMMRKISVDSRQGLLHYAQKHHLIGDV